MDQLNGSTYKQGNRTYPVWVDTRGREFIMKNKKTRKYINLPPVDKHARYERGKMGHAFNTFSAYRDVRIAKAKHTYMGSVE